MATWLEYFKKHPEKTFGLQKNQIIFVDTVHYPTKIQLQLPKELKEISPCGTNCGTCPNVENCICCPATIFYKQKKEKGTLES